MIRVGLVRVGLVDRVGFCSKHNIFSKIITRYVY
jgi:hypothetical protein